MNNAIGILTLAALMALVTAAANAAPITDPPPHDVHVRTMTSVMNDDGESESIMIKIENDDMVVVIDGEEVPSDRIRSEDGQIMILDEKGNEIRVLPHRFGGEFEFDVIGFPRFAMPEMEIASPPPVMLGISMNEPGPALRSHLRLAEGETTMVSHVYDGLPGDEAGLREFDIIVSIDGSKTAGHDEIRQWLLDKSDGDRLQLTIIRAGKRRQLTVTLAEYDAEKLQVGAGHGVDVGMFKWRQSGPGQGQFRDLFVTPDVNVFVPGGQFEGRIQDVLREHQQQLKGAERQLEGALDGRLERMGERMEDLEAMLDELLEQLQRSRDRDDR